MDNNNVSGKLPAQNFNVPQIAPVQNQTPQKGKGKGQSKKKEPLAMDSIELPVSENYGRNWEKYHGIREWISNWFDECRKMDKNPKVTKADSEERLRYDVTGICDGKETKLGHMEYDKKNKELILRNDTSQLSVRHLPLGASEKDSESIGRFGEGFKIGTLALLRSNCRVTVDISADRDDSKAKPIRGWIWDFKIAESETFHQKVLLLERTRLLSVKAAKMTGTTTKITNVLLNDIKPQNFLFFEPPTEIYETTNIVVLADPDLKGKIFRQGVFVRPMANFYYGYNVLKDEKQPIVDRDRNIVNTDGLVTLVMQGWSNLLHLSPDKWKLYERMIAMGGQCYECWNAKYLTWYACSSVRETAEGPIIVDDSKDVSNLADHLKVDKSRLVRCNTQLYKDLRDRGMMTVDEYQAVSLDKLDPLQLDDWLKQTSDPSVELFFRKAASELSSKFQFRKGELSMPKCCKTIGNCVVLNITRFERNHLHQESSCQTAYAPNQCWCVFDELVETVKQVFYATQAAKQKHLQIVARKALLEYSHQKNSEFKHKAEKLEEDNKVLKRKADQLERDNQVLRLKAAQLETGNRVLKLNAEKLEEDNKALHGKTKELAEEIQHLNKKLKFEIGRLQQVVELLGN